jgi:predicted regulator of Ras-like GTPase activity (Roadblock/LC7/MglB family)
MPRLEDVLAELAATPGARAAALAGLDGLLVDEARSASPAGSGLVGEDADLDLDGAIVEFTHAWHALRRASLEHLHGGAASELMLAGDRGVALARAVGVGWFALLWADVDVDLAAARAALARAASELTEVVA